MTQERMTVSSEAGEGLLCSVTLSVNAGVAIEVAGKKILIDAYHDEKTLEFSTVTPDLYKEMKRTEAFREPDLITCTHRHRDHYSQAMVEDAARRSPQTEIYLPPEDGTAEETLVLPTADGAVRVEFFRLTHTGKERREYPNYGILLSVLADSGRENRNSDRIGANFPDNGAQATRSILLTGDAEVGCPELAEMLAGRPVDLTLLNFSWMALGRGRDFVREVIRPKHLVLFHLPIAADDRYGYQSTLRRTLGRDETVKAGLRKRYAERAAVACPDIRILAEPLTRETFWL